jgi:hypothetical protein
MAAPRYMSSVALTGQQDLAKIEALAGLHPNLDIDPNQQAALATTVSNAFNANPNALAQVQAIVAAAGSNLEVPDPDPAQARLNLQLALNRLVSDEDAQTMARTDGKGFQILYNLTNDQMLTLCRLAVDVGAYQKTSDLNAYMDAFNGLDPAIKSLSPGALQKLGLPNSLGDGLIGSCSCCCP